MVLVGVDGVGGINEGGTGNDSRSRASSAIFFDMTDYGRLKG